MRRLLLLLTLLVLWTFSMPFFAAEPKENSSPKFPVQLADDDDIDDDDIDDDDDDLDDDKPKKPKRRGRKNKVVVDTRKGLDFDAIDSAIENGVKFLWSKQNADGSWPELAFCGGLACQALPKILKANNVPDDGLKPGTTGACIYALLETGVDVKDPRIVKALNWQVERMQEHRSIINYARAFRAIGFASAAKRNPTWKKFLKKDAAFLIRSMSHGGGHGYICEAKPPEGPADGMICDAWGDPSNTQYANLAIWGAAVNALEVPKEYWVRCLEYWLGRQRIEEGDAAYGGFGYSAISIKTGELDDISKGNRPHPYMAMTTAGVASLFVSIEMIYGDRFLKCEGTGNLYKSVNRGLDWMDKNFQKFIDGKETSKSPLYYTMYGIERCALASGYKYFGGHDWYKIGTQMILGEQRPDGSWPEGGLQNKFNGNDEIATAYALLFLMRGKHAVAINKLEFKGDWNNRPRDIANFTQWFSRKAERQVNWQIVTLKSPVHEWHDAPLLYISASKDIDFSDEELAKIRTYVYQGGTILSAAECNGRVFMKKIRDIYKRLFPRYEMVKAGKDHGLYNSHFKLRGVPRFEYIGNGVRTFVIHTDSDLPLAWQGYKTAIRAVDFQGGANVLMFVSDKGKLRRRGDSFWPDEKKFTTSMTVPVARIRVGGNYDAEPLAFTRLERLMGQKHGIKLDFVGSGGGKTEDANTEINSSNVVDGKVGLGFVDIASLPDSGAKIAFLSSPGPFKITPEQIKTIKKFVEDGGLLVLDAGNSSVGFTKSAKSMFEKMFPSQTLESIPSDSAVYSSGDVSVGRVEYRRASTRRARTRTPTLKGIKVGDRYGVIFSDEDITSGLVGYECFNTKGYRPDSAFEVMRNIILYANETAKSVGNGDDDN